MTKRFHLILKFYLCIEALLFIIIKSGEFLSLGRPLDIIKYSAVVCNFIMMTYLYNNYGHKLRFMDNLIALAFLFTLIADTFLCLINGIVIMGYLFLTLVETIYMFYLRASKKTVAARIILYIVLLFILKGLNMFTLTYAIAAANMAQLSINVYCAWRTHLNLKVTTTLLFALGITLFFGSDFSVAVCTVAGSGTLFNIARSLVWTCYLPAQALILLTYVNKIRRKLPIINKTEEGPL